MTCLPGILPPASAGVGGSQKGSLRSSVSAHDDFRARTRLPTSTSHPQHAGSFDDSHISNCVRTCGEYTADASELRRVPSGR